MKQVLSSLCAIAALMLVFGAFSYTLGQTPSATPDPFVTQLTSSPAGGNGIPFLSAAGDITANGRFVVFESNGNVATQNRNNADGNREIFLVDYAQRRIFQLTNTTNVQKVPASPTPTPTPTPTPSPAPSPTPTPGPLPANPVQIQIEISSNRPVMSYDPSPIVGGPDAGKRVYTIVFSSNAPSLPNFTGGTTVLPPDSTNQELWIYELPAVADVDLTTGAEVFQDLTLGTFRRITDTPASRASTPGGVGVMPFVADDNREAAIDDDGDIIAFISTRTFAVAPGNADGNPELFFATRIGPAWSSFGLAQGTNTQDEFVGARLLSRFQTNPSLSADGSRVAFMSTANLATPGSNNDDGNGAGNAEVYLANAVAGLSNVRQVTRTKTDATSRTVNLLSPGRRLSRDGTLIAFESLAADPKADSSTLQNFRAIFVYNVLADTFAEIATRPTTFPGDLPERFPTFTDYNNTLTPHSLVFSSALNFKTDGTFPPAAEISTGLNPTNQPQIFATTLPDTGNSYARLTKNPVGGFGEIRALASQERNRIAFTLGGSELGGGNADSSTEVFYLLVPTIVTNSGAALSFFAGGSNYPVATATPAPSPAPSPTPTPTPGTIAAGLAPGELSIVRSTVALGPAPDTFGVGGPETERSPILPIELNGVSVAVNGAAAGLYFVGDSPAEGIRYVMPIGLAAGVANVVVNNNGAVSRGFVQVVPSQPDIFSFTGDANSTAIVCNVTNPAMPDCLSGSFPLKSSNGTALVPTVLEIWVTGVRFAAPNETSVAIGTTNITPSSVRPNTNKFGFDLITLTLPASLAPGTHRVIVTVTKSGGTFRSRDATTAPTITITN